MIFNLFGILSHCISICLSCFLPFPLKDSHFGNHALHSLILIKHGDGWITAYGHTQVILVTRGQSVRRGQIIARAGETGSVDEPQLHFEIRDKRKPVDPLKYLPARS